MRPGTIVFAILVPSTVVLAPVPASALPIDNTRWCAVYGGRSGVPSYAPSGWRAKQ